MRNYVIGQDKCMVRVDSPLLSGWEACDDLKLLMGSAPSKLGDVEKEGLHFVGAKMPAELLRTVVATAAKFPHQETGYVLKYNLRTKDWKVVVPDMFTGGGASVQMTSEVTTDGFADIGTIHTHPGMSAHWSSVDIADQHKHPGIHILFGLRDGKVAEHLCSIFTRNNQYDIDIWEVCEQIDLAGDYEADEDWVKKLTPKPREHTISYDWTKDDPMFKFPTASSSFSRTVAHTNPIVAPSWKARLPEPTWAQQSQDDGRSLCEILLEEVADRLHKLTQTTGKTLDKDESKYLHQEICDLEDMVIEAQDDLNDLMVSIEMGEDPYGNLFPPMPTVPKRASAEDMFIDDYEDPRL